MSANNRRALLLGLSAVLLWSTVATAFKLALAELSVLQLLTVAICTSTVALVGTLVVRGRAGELLLTLRQQPGRYLLMGAINPTLYYGVLLAAYDLLPAQQAQTINYSWAIMLALLSVPVLGQRLALRDWLAIAVGYLGVVIIATQGDPLGMEMVSPLGVALALGCTVIWAMFWLLNTRSTTAPDLALAANFLCAIPIALLVCLVMGEPLPTPGTGLAAAVYVGFFEMGFTWLLWASALRAATNVSRVGNPIFLSPMLSLVFIATILHEPIHPATIVGLALILPGILQQQRGGT